ncbi:hypothetical protein PsAD2_02987 [Pseudovibrio axinellae]|uniref:Uncharacterized protein n=1 Tax=Pseudovibrio axinellae TaxID=989403 RepID=A0A165XF79_9HYPH|nr:hypothetical protein [Pseudovibrio axinellae]KZL17651.1 hypothetical protein PsAD2_02987 [Pseudovibrio axinellae]SER44929.1 hypothetical protein SAMN05421798_11095 [Pseudovibrio axinellae]
MAQPKQRASQIPLHDIQIFLGELQCRAKDRNGAPVREFQMHFEGEGVAQFLRMLYAAEYHLRNYEIRRVDEDKGRRKH